MRVLNLVAGQKWTGTAAVVFDQTAALVAAGVEAQFGFVGDSPLAERLLSVGWARPLMIPRRGPAAALAEARILSATLEREPFDVVHAHATHDHWLAGAVVRKSGARLARTLHNLRHTRRNPAMRWLAGRTDGFSYANREIAAAFGAPGPIHSPVIDTARFVPASSGAGARAAAAWLPEPSRLAGEMLVGTIGKMAEGRGHREAIRAAASIPEAVLAHVGHGELMPELKALAGSLGAAPRNVWLGYREDDLPELVRAWDVYLFTASGSEQGQRAILEAMSSGVAVVALAVPGVRDLMTDGREGLMVERPDELGPALARLAADPALRAAMGARGRERALAFTAGEYAKQAIAFYEGILRLLVP